MESDGGLVLVVSDDRNGSIGLVLGFPAAQSLFTALLFDVADGERPPNSEPGWLGFTIALDGK